MPSRAIPPALLVAALAAALAAPGDRPPPGVSGTALADTVSGNPDWLAKVTMEPIRVVIPRPEGAGPDSQTPPRR